MVPLLIALVASLSSNVERASAGEISGGIGDCDLSNFISKCEWKATNCYKPSAPVIITYDVASYNRAVEDYNLYLGEVARFKDCLVSEGKRDVSDNFPGIVIESVKRQADEVDRDAQNARSMLEISRPH